jgi:hypothetical protein
MKILGVVIRVVIYIAGNVAPAQNEKRLSNWQVYKILQNT